MNRAKQLVLHAPFRKSKSIGPGVLRRENVFAVHSFRAASGGHGRRHCFAKPKWNSRRLTFRIFDANDAGVDSQIRHERISKLE